MYVPLDLHFTHQSTSTYFDICNTIHTCGCESAVAARVCVCVGCGVVCVCVGCGSVCVCVSALWQPQLCVLLQMPTHLEVEWRVKRKYSVM